MGDLETIARELAPLVLLERKEEAASIDVLARDKSEIADALKDVRESIDGKLQDKAREELKAVVEQDIDPAVYNSADYSATVSYGKEVQVAYTYKGLGHDGSEANSSSYNVSAAIVEETKRHEIVHQAHESAKEAQMMGRMEQSSFDPVAKNAKQETTMRYGLIFSFMQYALLGKIDFL